MMKKVISLVVMALVGGGALMSAEPERRQAGTDYQALVALFKEIRASQQPGMVGGVPDYRPAAVQQRFEKLQELGQRLDRFDSSGWPIAQRVDHMLVITDWRSHDFTHRIMHPWSRDPGFYVDMVARVPFTPLPAEGSRLPAFRTSLESVPRILEQAKQNLTEGAGELARLAIRNLEQADGVGHGHPRRETPPAGVIGWYADLAQQLSTHHPDLLQAARAAERAVTDFRDWLEANQGRMNAPAGIGLDNYTYFQKYVRLMPYTAEDNLRLGERELNRGRAFLAIERHRNRDEPPLEPAGSEAEYTRRKEEADRHIRDFIRSENILTIPEYVQALDTNVPWIVRPGGKRNFWEEIQFRDPRPDHVHAVIPGHRFDGLLHSKDTRPIRGAYRDGGRSEGWGFYLEEMFLQAGLLEDLPRTRELFYLFQIKRATRNRAEVKMHANEFTVADATRSMVENVQYLDDDVARVDAEIYLRRPGYGSGYQMGKLQMDQLLADRYHQLGDKFNLKEFHDAFLAAGTIPISLIRWEMTGHANEIEGLWTRQPQQLSSPRH